MKIRITVVLLVLTLMLAICGCGSSQSDSNISDTNVSETVSSSVPEKTSSEQSTDTSSVESKTEESQNPDNGIDSPEEEIEVAEWKSHPEDYKLIALTFDDVPYFESSGNNPTTKIIDTIAKYEGSGTLFVVGKNLDDKGSGLLNYALMKGFEIGNHTYSHKSVSTDTEGKNWTAEQNKDDILKCSNAIKLETGFDVKVFRPAGAHTNDALYTALSDLGLPSIVGNRVTPVSDWNSSVTTEQIVENVFANVYDGAIILLHGQMPNTAAATELFCKTLYEDGYRFCTVEELFLFKGKSLSECPKFATVYGIDPQTGEIQTTKEY